MPDCGPAALCGFPRDDRHRVSACLARSGHKASVGGEPGSVRPPFGSEVGRVPPGGEPGSQPPVTEWPLDLGEEAG